jgi:hypothetical protein
VEDAVDAVDAEVSKKLNVNVNEEAVNDLKLFAVAEDVVAQEEVAQEEVAQEEVAQEEVAQEEVAQEEVAQEEVAQVVAGVKFIL